MTKWLIHRWVYFLCIIAILLYPELVTGQNQKGTPNIPAFRVEELVSFYQKAKGVIVVNFWSTWCKPCIEEIPHFISVTKQFEKEGVALLLVSLDTRSIYTSGELQRWLQKRQWQASIAWLDETDADYYCPKVDSSWSGVIPATVVINPSTGFFRFFEESLAAEDLEAVIKKAIAPRQ